MPNNDLTIEFFKAIDEPCDISITRRKLESLIQQDKNLLDTINTAGLTPLHWAIQCKSPRIEVIEYLIVKGADVTLRDNYGRTALHWAVEKRAQLPLRIFELLCCSPQGKKILDMQNDDGKTALHLAVRSAQEDIVARLFDYGANTTLRDRRGQTALYLAAAYHTLSKELFKHLVIASKDVLDQLDHEGRSATHRALRDPIDTDRCMLLLHAGANPYIGFGPDQISEDYISFLLAWGVPIIATQSMHPTLTQALTTITKRQPDLNTVSLVDILLNYLPKSIPIPSVSDNKLKALDDELGRAPTTADIETFDKKRNNLKHSIKLQPPYIDIFGKNWLEAALNSWQTHGHFDQAALDYLAQMQEPARTIFQHGLPFLSKLLIQDNNLQQAAAVSALYEALKSKKLLLPTSRAAASVPGPETQALSTSTSRAAASVPGPETQALSTSTSRAAASVPGPETQALSTSTSRAAASVPALASGPSMFAGRTRTIASKPSPLNDPTPEPNNSDEPTPPTLT